ncbi:MAG: hypothetical protein NC324_03465 [Bacteroides sp.]|nr:hypothetical protein [Bacteroides sp.]
MEVTISNPDRIIFKGEAKLLQLPGADGSFEVMERHAPILSLLAKGKVRLVDHEDKEQFFEIQGGLFGMAQNSCRILLTA